MVRTGERAGTARVVSSSFSSSRCLLITNESPDRHHAKHIVARNPSPRQAQTDQDPDATGVNVPGGSLPLIDCGFRNSIASKRLAFTHIS